MEQSYCGYRKTDGSLQPSLLRNKDLIPLIDFIQEDNLLVRNIHKGGFLYLMMKNNCLQFMVSRLYLRSNL